MSTKHICLPFPSEVQYRTYVDDPAQGIVSESLFFEEWELTIRRL
jgi:hypothetical protein